METGTANAGLSCPGESVFPAEPQKGIPKSMNDQNEKTLTFSLKREREEEIRSILQTVYRALQQKGYNPVNQLVGYILSEDPTYITNYNGARSLICKLDRDELLNVLVSYYLGL